jgi:hypothetical protein
MGFAVVRHDVATARGVQWRGARRRRAEPGPAWALGAAVPSGTAWFNGRSAVPGPPPWHGDTIRHGTPPCLTVLCLAVPCLGVPLPCRAWAARLDNYSFIP